MRIVDHPLQGITVGIPEARYGEALAKLFQRAGARVELCPLVTEQILEDRSSIKSFIELTIAGAFDMVIFMTGIGANLIFREAQTTGKWDAFLLALSKTVVVSRGSKSTASLKQANVRIDIIPQSATSEGLIEVMNQFNVAGRQIALQLYGTPNPLLTTALEKRGAEVFPVSVYSYETASAASDVEAFIRKVFAGEIQVIVFTSAPQVRALFEASASLKFASTLAQILAGGVQIASIGEVTTRALKSYGVKPHVVPDQPKLGAMVKAICTTRSF